MAQPKHDLLTPILQTPLEHAQRLQRQARHDDEAEALEAILHEVQRFCRKHVDSHAIDKRGALGPELLHAVAEQGWFGLTIPERFGGAGLSMSAATRVVSELSYFNGSLATCVGLHSGLGLQSLIHVATTELQERYLPEVAAGKRIAAFAATEPSAGSDIAAMRSILREEDGKLILRGSKCFVTNGGLCGVLTTVASSPGLGGARSGHTMVVVDPKWEGVSLQGEEHKLGLKGSSTLTIDFDDVVVPRDHVIGEVSKGLDLAHRALTWGRTYMAAGCLGSARAALEQARVHTSERVQFGRTLDRFPLVREQLAQATAMYLAAESVIRLVCDRQDNGLDIALDSTVAKIFVSETAWDIIDRSLQLMGGTGYIEEAGMARRLRDMRVTRIFEGANDVLRLHLASATLGWSPDALRSLPKLAGHLPAELADEAAQFDELAARLGDTLARIRKTHGFKLFDKQSLQSTMSEALISTYACLAVLLRAAAPTDQSNLPLAPTAKLASRLLVRRANAALMNIPQVEAGADGALVDQVLGA